VLLWRTTSSDGEREHALQLLDRACETADDFACAELGDALYDTHELKGDSAFGKAHVAYEKGCKLGSMVSCLSDGWMLRRGEGTTKDNARARELFRLVCDHQGYNGCAALGYDLTDGAKNGDELAEGARLLKLACEHDDAFGCFSLGARLLVGGDRAALDDGLRLLKRSCALGLQNGCRYASTVEDRLKRGTTAAATGGEADDNEDEDEDEDEDER
jgi:TPR repeat protein